MKVLAVIPAYNEEESLATAVSSLAAACPDIDYLVVNDGSADDTERVCQVNRLDHVTLPVNTGLASAIRTGMKYAYQRQYDAVVQYDADGQHVPEFITEMARVLESERADIVIASRVLAGDAPQGLRNAGSKLLSWLIKQTTGATITDPTSGMRMYNQKMIEMFAEGFDIQPEPDTIALIAKQGGRIVEIPAQIRERQAGESYFTTASSVSYMLRMAFSILLYQWLR